MPAGDIKYETKGIASVLRHEVLFVPPNQRDYAWEDEHVTALIDDISKAIGDRKDSYFLGTVVLTKKDSGAYYVADGQQRLATAMIWLAGIRDHFDRTSDQMQAERIENQFLSEIDPNEEVRVSRLTLNVADHAFFKDAILSPESSREPISSPRPLSNQRLARASEVVTEKIAALTRLHGSTSKQRLKEQIDYLERQALVIVLKVPSDVDAFVMFETLNDRGLKTSQTDLLKNYLFREAGQEQLATAQERWGFLRGTLEAVDEDDIMMTYFRQLLITMRGPTREREVFTTIKSDHFGTTRSIEFVKQAAEAAADYAAILTPAHQQWSSCPSTRKAIDALAYLRVKQIRSLMLAIARTFPPDEVERAFTMFVSWTVRILTSGGRGGTLEEAYAQTAQRVGNREITDAAGVLQAMVHVVPTDQEFQAGFAIAKVSKNYLARYYLRALEKKIRSEAEPEFLPNEGPEITLEHVLPQNPSDEWGIDPGTAGAIYKRLGNMALLRASVNSDIGNAGFHAKKQVLANSQYVTTKGIAEYACWGVEQINDRQGKLADHAVETWPLTPTP